ncbi:ATP-dependent Clp protease proteolytic subunit 4, chloroplastic-like [Curcuma longa]|uniref:ATP-dependent Clp protease proteolytic subunit 4, chloroplastic-like n=1 Tax=Curcuma longa TaxID=136217 RepID=UPI003D9F0877
MKNIFQIKRPYGSQIRFVLLLQSPTKPLSASSRTMSSRFVSSPLKPSPQDSHSPLFLFPWQVPSPRVLFLHLDLHLKVLSGPQTPASAARGAESDVMGLLLRERIVFLGTSVDDFVADAIIIQLLLLDAMDPTKDIRLFINYSCGSLRLDESPATWLGSGRSRWYPRTEKEDARGF